MAALIRTQDGLRLAVHEWDGGAERLPLLCLPGFARTGLDFAGVAARHGAGRRVVSLDYVGRGASDRADLARYAPEAMLRDVLDAAAALHLHRCAVIGTSFGGIMAMGIGAARPAMLERVVLNDIGPDPAGGGLDEIIALLGTDHAFPTLAAAVAFLRARLTLAVDDAGWEEVTSLTFELRDGAFRPRWDPRIAQLLGGKRPDLWPLFGALAPVPLMLLRGAQSTLLRAESVARMRAARPDLDVVEIPGSGHAPTLAEPEAVAALARCLA